MATAFIPVLDLPPNDVLIDDAKMIDYLLSFIFYNPGNTSELNEKYMHSLGTIHMKSKDDPDYLISKYTDMLQQVFNSNFGPGVYNVKITSEDVNENEFKLAIRILDNNGEIKTVSYDHLNRLKSLQKATIDQDVYIEEALKNN